MLPLTTHAATGHTHRSGSSRRCDTTRSRLDLTRTQILAFRRHVGALDERLPRGRRSLRRAAWAGLQDSMPRAALLSIHARVEGTEPSTWEDPSLVQLWGPRYNAYVVAARDLAVFSLGRLPDDAKAPADGGGPGRSPARSPRRDEDDLRRGGARARRASQRAPVRRADRHGPDPVGRRAAADHLDRAATRGRPARGPPRARTPVPARLRPRHARGVRPVGGDQPRGEASRRSTRSAGR